MTGLRLIFAGSGAFGLPTLRSLGGEVVQVVSQPDRPAGRGRKLVATPIAQWAMENHLPLLRTERINEEKLEAADAMVVIAFGQKISREQADRPRLGSVNLHGSLLPLCRGAAPIPWTILSGRTFTGNSVIRLAERMDAGAILGQSRIEIGPVETAGELHDRLAEDGAALVARVLSDLAAGKAVETAQDESQATRASKLSRRDALSDWSANAESIALRIRALWPWPRCHAKVVDAAGGDVARVALVRARAAISEGPRWHPGEIEASGDVCAGNGGAVEILELQPEGGRVMKLDEYRRGHRWTAGLRLESPA